MTKLACALLAATSLLSLTSLVAADVSPKVVGFPIERHVRRDNPRRLARRQTVSADITNEELLYFINVTVGTPPQPFSLQLDTGSSDIWFPAANSDICRNYQQDCTFGSYSLSQSSSGADIGQGQFQIRYVDGSEIQGDYISDVLNIGKTQLKNLTMAAALTASRGVGIMGIGYASDESAATISGVTYPNVINLLKDQGFINTLAYSLWLNDLDSTTGNILFGGVDTAKYHGDLVGLPIQADSQSGNLTSFTVALSSLTFTSAGQTSTLTSTNSAFPAILDSGTTITLLPDDIANQIFNGIGVTSDQSYGNVVPCKLANSDATFSFTFGGPNGPVIHVSLSEFITPLLTTDGSTPTFKNGDQACTFGIDAAGKDPILFGDTFLRSAYVVYDLQNNLIGLAQTNFNATGSNIKEISSGGIPGLTSTATAVQVTQTFSGHPLQTQGNTVSASNTPVGGTQRSATFKLGSATASASATGSATAKPKSVAATVRAPSAVARTTVFAGVMALANFLFGGSLMIFL